MLVLTRKLQEKIRIGDDIVITVLRTKGKSVRLGIEAPEAVPVLRGEIALERDSENGAPLESASAVAESEPSRRLDPPGEVRLPRDRWEARTAPFVSAGPRGDEERQVVCHNRVPREQLLGLPASAPTH